MKITTAIVLAFAIAFGIAGDARAQPSQAELENILYLDLKQGRVAIKLRPDLAPGHVARAKKLAREGFYDGIVFHRVIDGFMAQSGDPTGTGRGGSKYPDLKAEFSSEPFRRGTLGAARQPGMPDSANSQFFICFEEKPHLNGQYTVWGEVIRGMHLVDAIKKGSPGSGVVRNPDKIVKVVVAADASDHSVLSQPDPLWKRPPGGTPGQFPVGSAMAVRGAAHP